MTLPPTGQARNEPSSHRLMDPTSTIRIGRVASQQLTADGPPGKNRPLTPGPARWRELRSAICRHINCVQEEISPPQPNRVAVVRPKVVQVRCVWRIAAIRREEGDTLARARRYLPSPLAQPERHRAWSARPTTAARDRYPYPVHVSPCNVLAVEADQPLGSAPYPRTMHLGLSEHRSRIGSRSLAKRPPTRAGVAAIAPSPASPPRTARRPAGR